MRYTAVITSCLLEICKWVDAIMDFQSISSAKNIFKRLKI